MWRGAHFLISISTVEAADGVMKMTDQGHVIPEFMLAEHKKYTGEPQIWHAAFKPFLEAARKLEGKKNSPAATV